VFFIEQRHHKDAIENFDTRGVKATVWVLNATRHPKPLTLALKLQRWRKGALEAA
jgi:hypothetical protein